MLAFFLFGDMTPGIANQHPSAMLDPRQPDQCRFDLAVLAAVTRLEFSRAAFRHRLQDCGNLLRRIFSLYVLDPQPGKLRRRVAEPLIGRPVELDEISLDWIGQHNGIRCHVIHDMEQFFMLPDCLQRPPAIQHLLQSLRDGFGQ